MIALFGIPDRTDYDVKGILNKEEGADDYFDIKLYYGKLKVSVKTSLFVSCHIPDSLYTAQMAVYEIQSGASVRKICTGAYQGFLSAGTGG